MRVKDILKKIEDFAPPALAYSWDNVGLLVGDAERDVKRILITLDPDVQIIEEAVNKECDLIVSHHPMFFKGIKHIRSEEPVGKSIELMIKNDISLIAAHTNMDCAERGVNAGLAELMELNDVVVLEENPEFKECGLGRVGNLKKSMTLRELAEYTKDKLKIKGIRAAGNENRVIRRIAVAGGSCSEVIPLAISKGAEAIITGDMKYHETINAVNDGICVLDAGHYGTEHHVIDIFDKLLRPLGIEMLHSENPDVFMFM